MLKENRDKFWILLIIVIVLGTLYVDNRLKNGKTDDSELDIVKMKDLCESNGAFWNECGSACAGRNVEYCTLQCVQQCECGFADYECPSGYECAQEEGAQRGVCKLEE